ncbi:APC family permease [Nocardioides ungokensis]|uniref:APC family permease n=1 Tax=Nocardioides ungokensis TaxID=1643322 RepID=UPI001C60E849|nr:APC family permease [Nocardioides ungokensis]
MFSYLGFRQGIEFAGETDNPHRNVPIAVVGSVLITGLIYVALQVAFIGALDPSDLEKSGSWANLTFSGDFGPLAAVATALGLGWLAILLYADAIISPGDTGLIYTTTTSRISYAMAKNRNAPQALARTTDRGVPMISLIVTFLVGLIVFLPFPSWQQLVGFITSATVLSFASGPLVLGALRRRLPQAERPFRVPGGHLIPVIAFFASNLIVYWSGWDIVWKLAIAVAIGFVLLPIYKALGNDVPDLDFAAGASWVLPWLGGLVLLSWLGNYPEPAAGNLNILTFETSIPLILVFSVAIYALAMKFCLPTPEMERHIEATKEEAALEEEELGSAP